MIYTFSDLFRAFHWQTAAFVKAVYCLQALILIATKSATSLGISLLVIACMFIDYRKRALRISCLYSHFAYLSNQLSCMISGHYYIIYSVSMYNKVNTSESDMLNRYLMQRVLWNLY